MTVSELVTDGIVKYYICFYVIFPKWNLNHVRVVPVSNYFHNQQYKDNVFNNVYDLKQLTYSF